MHAELIIARLEKLTGPDRGADGRIAWYLGWRFNGFLGKGPEDEAEFDLWPERGGHWHQPGDDFCHGDQSYDPDIWPDPPEWTASLDATIALVERLQPGWAWFVEQINVPTFKCAARLWIPAQRTQGLKIENIHVEAATPAIALLIALLRSLPNSGDRDGNGGGDA